MELTIGEKKFSIKKPVRKQIQLVFALSKEYGFTSMFSQAKKTEEEQLAFGIDLASTDFESRFATIALVEVGKEFKDSYELNKDLIYDYFENVEAGVVKTDKLMTDFFGLMPQAIIPDKKGRGR